MAMKDDRFVSPRPKFTPPTDPHNVLKPPQKDHTPGVPLKEQEDNKLVQQLLVEAKMLSSKIIKEFPDTSSSPIKLQFCEAHVLDDRRFLECTRSMKVSDKGAFSLLLANGGRKYLAQKMLPAQAFDALRKEKMIALRPTPDKSFDKFPKCKGRVRPIAGAPTATERAARIGMYLVKSETIKQKESKEEYYEEDFPVS